VTDVVAKGSPLGGGGPVTRRQAVLPPASRRGARDACQPTMAGCRCSLMTMHARISGRAGPGGKRGGRARKDRPRPGRGRRARVAGTSRRGAHVGARARARRMETAAAARREGRVARDGAGRGRSTTLGVRSGPRRADPAATVACRCHRRWPGAAGMPAARNIPVRAWSPVGTGHHGALGLSYSASDEVKYRRLSLARVHACLSMLGAQRIGGVNGIFATSRCMCHCVRQDLISVQFYCTVTTAYLVTELSIIGTNLMVRSFPSSLLIMFLPYQQFC